MLCSARECSGITEVWQAIERHRAALAASGETAARRAAQAEAWMWSELNDALLVAVKRDRRVAALLPALELQVTAGEVTPSAAAAALVAAFRGKG